MSQYNGYFLKNTVTNVVFPMKYIDWESYDCTPKQREEIKAYRDENTRDLFRVTAPGMKTKIEFSTRENLSLEQKMEIQSFFRTGSSDWHQRKVRLQYWDDENNIYDVGDFYIPDIKYPIKYVTETTIFYKKIDIHLVEY